MKRAVAFLLVLCLMAGLSCCSKTPSSISVSIPEDMAAVTATPTPTCAPTVTPSPSPTKAPTKVPTPTVTPAPTPAVQGSIPYHTRAFADKVSLHIFLWGTKAEDRYEEVLENMRDVGYIYEPIDYADISLEDRGITLYIGDGWAGRGVEWYVKYRGEPCYVHIATLTEEEMPEVKANLHNFNYGKRQHSLSRETVLSNGYICSRKKFMGATVEMWELDPFAHNDTYYIWFMPDERHVVSIICYLKTAEEREEMLRQLNLIQYRL